MFVFHIFFTRSSFFFHRSSVLGLTTQALPPELGFFVLAGTVVVGASYFIYRSCFSSPSSPTPQPSVDVESVPVSFPDPCNDLTCSNIVPQVHRYVPSADPVPSPALSFDQLARNGYPTPYQHWTPAGSPEPLFYDRAFRNPDYWGDNPCFFVPPGYPYTDMIFKPYTRQEILTEVRRSSYTGQELADFNASHPLPVFMNPETHEIRCREGKALLDNIYSFLADRYRMEHHFSDNTPTYDAVLARFNYPFGNGVFYPYQQYVQDLVQSDETEFDISLVAQYDFLWSSMTHVLVDIVFLAPSMSVTSIMFAYQWRHWFAYRVMHMYRHVKSCFRGFATQRSFWRSSRPLRSLKYLNI